MIDDQKVAYEEILRLSELSQKDGRKRTVIVQGGPGTGKTVIAVNLLAELTMRDQVVQYVSKNSAPRQVYLRKLKGQMKKSSVDNMFKSSGAYTEEKDNVVHTLLADEAHRLNKKSGMFHNKGENQVKEIIHASFCSVFFIDESQRVTMDDIGSVAEIEKWAGEEGSEVYYLELQSQFRCNGSDGYLAWIDDVLDIRKTANYNLEGMDYNIRICDSLEEMRDIVVEHNKTNHCSRILAGYCWDWLKVSESSINEVGCIHTSQGLEFDYVGVIIGDDMRFENGKIITDFTKRARTDQSLKGIKKLYKEDPEEAEKRADEIIKNTYRTLLTRGMKGCCIYCTDPGMQSYMTERLKGWKNEAGNDR